MNPSLEQAAVSESAESVHQSKWGKFHPATWNPYLLLGAMTLACLIPFLGKAFNVDDTLFLWAAQQITRHPFDPYGFKLIWNTTEVSMFAVTKNPPLASYLAACVGSIGGWSESALHIGFLFPALALVLGTYRLARRFTDLPLLASFATLSSAGILISATSVMCDTTMLALWVWAIELWIEGSDGDRPLYLLASAFLVAACAMTKYFGISLLMLLPLYSIMQGRKLKHLLYLLVPLALLLSYQFWTQAIYGRGLLLDAAVFSRAQRDVSVRGSALANSLVGLSFAGGCMLPALAAAPLLWRRRWIFAGAVFSLVAGFAITRGWINLGTSELAGYVHFTLLRRWIALGFQLAICIAAGVCVFVLVATAVQRTKDAKFLFLAAWVAGTFVFAVFLNWTINARSVLPIVPAAAILLASALGASDARKQPYFMAKVVLLLIGPFFIAVWAARGDAAWANTQRQAAQEIAAQGQKEHVRVWFQGHWGFQYYMQALGAQPVDFEKSTMGEGDLLAIPANNIETFPMKGEYILSSARIEIPYAEHITSMRVANGSGFYAAVFGPLPFVYAPSRPERYFLFHVKSTAGQNPWK